MSKFDIPIEIVNWSDVKNLKSTVYVLINKYYIHGFYKIGYTNRKNSTLNDRIREQERSEQVIPNSIRCVIIIDTDNPEVLENKMHNDLYISKFRESKKREWFKLDINDIYRGVINHSKGIANKIYIIKGTADEFGLKYNKPTASDFNFGDYDYKKLAYDKNKDNRRHVKRNEYYDALDSGKYSSKYIKDIIFEYDKERDLWRIIEEDEWYTYDNLTNGPWKSKEKKTLPSVLKCKGYSKSWGDKTGWCKGLTKIL